MPFRACADGSGSVRRSPLPTVTAPCFPDQPPDDDDHLREGHPEIDHPPSALRAPHEFLVGVVPRTRPLYHPPIAGPERCRLALLRDLGFQPSLFEALAGGLRVVSAVEMDVGPLGQPSEGLGHRLEGFGQQWRVVAALAGAANVPRGMPSPSTIVERL